MGPRFAGRTVIVTGAARGQGAAEARLFATEGANVVAADVLVNEGEKLADEIRAAGGTAIFVRLDVSRQDDWSDVEAQVRREFGALHVLVNNAGIALRRPSMQVTTLEDWNRVIGVNLTGPFLGIRTLSPLIRDSGGGAIVNTGSIAGVTGHFATAYSASKWGLRGLTKSSAMELADWSIRVNTVHPGIVITPIVDGSEDFVAAMEAMTPQGRAGSSEDMANIVAFLASDDAKFITGVDLAADGGFAELAAYRHVLKQVRAASAQRL
jgi:NAD(P)-dependent dehydrogenase (short-subunit alcohol dehydrogenase family)